MQIVLDLMDAYVDHIGLPLTLMTADGEISSEQGLMKNSLPKEVRMGIVETIQEIKSPTVLSRNQDDFDGEIFYLVTPKFGTQNEIYVLVAGPYRLTSPNLTMERQDLPNVCVTQIDQLMKKFKNLFSIFSIKNNVETNLLISKEIFEATRFIDHVSIDTVDDENLFERLITLLNKTNVIDFIGYATYSEEGCFEIPYIIGERAKGLINTRFYLGEGILGQAFLNKDSFFWEKEKNNSYLEFFQRHGLQPDQVFGLPIMKGKYQNRIIFGGSFTPGQMHHADMYFLNSILLLITQKTQWSREIRTFHNTHALFMESVLLLDSFNESKENRTLPLKLLDFCERLNNHGPCVVTLSSGQLFVRNQVDDRIQKCHLDMLQASKLSPYIIQQQEKVIHFYIEGIGTYSIDFGTKEELYNEMMILTSLLKQLQILNQESLADYNKLFDLSYRAMHELKGEKVQEVEVALQMLDELTKLGSIDRNCARTIQNLIKVMPYSEDYIKAYFGETLEYKVFRRMMDSQPLPESEVKIETKLLAFLDGELFGMNRFPGQIVSDKERKEFFHMLKPIQANVGSRYAAVETTKNPSGEIVVSQLKMEESVEELTITAREKQVLILVMNGLSNQEIANQLYISTHTVKNHITNIFKKLDVVDRYQAMRKVLKL